MRFPTSALVIAVVAVSLTACGGGAGKGAGGKDQPGHGTSASPLTRIAVPAGYDRTKGWEQALTWMPEEVRSVPVAASQGSDGVAYLDSSEDGYVPVVRDVGTGGIRWRGKPWQPPASVDDPSAGNGDAVEIPGVVVVRQGGRDYVVAWAHGTVGKDDLNKGKEIVEVLIYPADAKGDPVAPARTVRVPVKDVDDHRADLKVRDGGAGLLITWDGDDFAAVVDMVSGKVGRYDDPGEVEVGCEYTGCVEGNFVAASAYGPVISNSNGGFGVEGRWYSRDVAPAGAATEVTSGVNGHVVTGAAGDVIATWTAQDDGADLWAVHDAATGKVRAQVACADEKLLNDDRTPVRLSPSGRYLVYDVVAFDLKTGKGRCFAESEDREAVRLVTVGDDGIAYGMTGESAFDDEAGTPVSVSLTSGSAKALTKGLEIPVAVYGDRGLFVAEESGNTRRIVVYART